MMVATRLLKARFTMKYIPVIRNFLYLQEIHIYKSQKYLKISEHISKSQNYYNNLTAMCMKLFITYTMKARIMSRFMTTAIGITIAPR